MLAKPVIIKSNEAPLTPRASNKWLTSNEFHNVEKFLSNCDQTPIENMPFLLLEEELEQKNDFFKLALILTAAQKKEQ